MKIVWDQIGERFYETGTKKGVLYPQDDKGAYPKGVAWNGLTGVTEGTEGGEETKLWADDIKYLGLMSAEEFKPTIKAYMYPDEFGPCDGSAEVMEGVTVGQQARQPFGMSYVTTIGNDVKGNDFGYKLHLVWGAKASPSEKAYGTINNDPNAIEFSWDCNTTPVEVVDGFKPTAHMVINSTKVDATKLAALEAILYGSDDVEARLPLPAEVLTTLGYTKPNA